MLNYLNDWITDFEQQQSPLRWKTPRQPSNVLLAVVRPRIVSSPNQISLSLRSSNLSEIFRKRIYMWTSRTTSNPLLVRLKKQFIWIQLRSGFGNSQCEEFDSLSQHKREKLELRRCSPQKKARNTSVQKAVAGLAWRKFVSLMCKATSLERHPVFCFGDFRLFSFADCGQIEMWVLWGRWELIKRVILELFVMFPCMFRFGKLMHSFDENGCFSENVRLRFYQHSWNPRMDK